MTFCADPHEVSNIIIMKDLNNKIQYPAELNCELIAIDPLMAEQKPSALTGLRGLSQRFSPVFYKRIYQASVVGSRVLNFLALFVQPYTVGPILFVPNKRKHMDHESPSIEKVIEK